jgi:hypothetical protein
VKWHLHQTGSLFAACGRNGSIIRDGFYRGTKSTTVVEHVTCLPCLLTVGRAVRGPDRKLALVGATSAPAATGPRFESGIL